MATDGKVETEPVTEKDEMRLKLELQNKQLKLKCLKVDYDSKRNILTGKINDNEKLIDHLTNYQNYLTKCIPVSAMAIKTAIDKLNEYTAKLLEAIDNLDNQYEFKISQITSLICELQYDLR